MCSCQMEFRKAYQRAYQRVCQKGYQRVYQNLSLSIPVGKGLLGSL